MRNGTSKSPPPSDPARILLTAPPSTGHGRPAVQQTTLAHNGLRRARRGYLGLFASVLRTFDGSSKEKAPMVPKKLYTTKETTAMLGVSKAFLERDRWKGVTIPYAELGTRTVRYPADVINRILASRGAGPINNQ